MNQKDIDEFRGVKDIISYLSKKHNLDKRVVESVTRIGFIKMKRKMADLDDEDTIMFKYFGKFRLRKMYRGNKRTIKESKIKNEQRINV